MSASLRPSSRAPQVVVEEWCLSALLHLRNIRRPSPGKHRRASPTTAASCWWAHMLAHNPPNSCVLPYGEAEFEQMHMPECWSQRTTAPAHARACVLRTVVLLRCRLVRPRVGSAKAQRCQHLSSTRRQIPRFTTRKYTLHEPLCALSAAAKNSVWIFTATTRARAQLTQVPPRRTTGWCPYWGRCSARPDTLYALN